MIRISRVRGHTHKKWFYPIVTENYLKRTDVEKARKGISPKYNWRFAELSIPPDLRTGVFEKKHESLEAHKIGDGRALLGLGVPKRIDSWIVSSKRLMFRIPITFTTILSGSTIEASLGTSLKRYQTYSD